MSTPDIHREIEHKLDVPTGFRLPRLTTIAGVGAAREMPVLHLTATYFDTPELRLARHRVTLRRRTGGGDDGWHLKLPADDAPGNDADDHGDDLARDELHLPLDTPGAAAGAPPAALSSLVVGRTRGAPLAPVATLHTERRPTVLLADDGRALAEVTDDRVRVTQHGKTTTRFREIEVEAAADRGAADLDGIVAALVAAGATPSGFRSKAVRALGPAAQGPADVGEPAPVGRHDPAGAAVAAHLARHVAAFQREDLRVRRDLPDSVHQMRVAARQLRSGLKAFGPLVDAAWAGGLRDELAWFADKLGAARDREVLEARLEAGLRALRGPDGGPLPEAAAAEQLVRRSLHRQARAARRTIAAGMESERYVALLDSLIQAAAHPVLTDAAAEPCGTALPPLVRRSWKRLAHDVRELDRSAGDDQWHRARIRAKQARYAVDAVQPVFGKPAKRLERRLARVTDVLGRHQDAAVAAAHARTLAAQRGVDGRTGFALGLLHAAQRAELVQARREFLDAWPDVARPRLRRWL